MTPPLVSIITPSLNQGLFIEQSIRSVLDQTYPNIEYILIDGGSTDDTLSVLDRYQHRFTHLICEQDDGQASALNKGFDIASGEVIAWLNADDILFPDAVSHVVEHFERYRLSQFVYGDAIAIGKHGGRFGRRVNVQPTNHWSLVNVGDFIVQPAAFWRRTVLDRVGPLDANLKYTLDYEYWMRVSQSFEMDYLEIPLAYERLYGETKTSRGGVDRIDEIREIAQRYGGEDIPQMFRPEAAATYMLQAIQTWLTGDRTNARLQAAKARQLNNNQVKFLLHLVAQLLWGGRGTIRLRLVSNWLRNIVNVPSLQPRVQRVRIEESLT